MIYHTNDKFLQSIKKEFKVPFDDSFGKEPTTTSVTTTTTATEMQVADIAIGSAL